MFRRRPIAGHRDDTLSKRTGRRRKTKPFEMTLRSANGATITVKFRKAQVDPEEVVAALEDVLRSLRRQAA